MEIKSITQKEPTEEYHLVLQKFLNLILFKTLKNPNFKRNQEVDLSQILLDFCKSLNEYNGDKRASLFDQFFKKIFELFKKKINEDDIVDLMNCYGFSNFRTISNVIKMIGSSNLNTLFDPSNRNEQILNEMLYGDALPIEIKAYLIMQFFDVIARIPNDSKSISKETYQSLVNRYVGEYDYNKVLNIVYKHYDEIE